MDTEFARLQALDLHDSVKDVSGVRLFHGRRIYSCAYSTTRNDAIRALSLNGVLRPFRSPEKVSGESNAACLAPIGRPQLFDPRHILRQTTTPGSSAQVIAAYSNRVRAGLGTNNFASTHVLVIPIHRQFQPGLDAMAGRKAE